MTRRQKKYRLPNNQRGKVPRVLALLDSWPLRINFNGPEFQFDDLKVSRRKASTTRALPRI